MTTVIQFDDGREIVVSSDLGKIRITIWANKGCLGTELPSEIAMEAAAALIKAVRKAKREG
jgi:hypothetical protein